MAALPALNELEVRLANDAQLVAFNAAMHDIFYEGWPVTRQDLDTGFAELSNHPTRRDGKCLTWVLVRSSDPDGEAFTFTHTLRRVGLVRRPGMASSVEKGYFYSIQSVCTPRQYRRQGYSRHLLRTIHYILGPTSHLPPFPLSLGKAPIVDRALVPEALGSVLSSDLVAGWYEKCIVGDVDASRAGWISRDNHANADMYFDLGSLEAIADPEWGYELLYARDYDRLGSVLSSALERRLLNTPEDKTTLIIPDPLDSDWLTHHELFGRVRASRLQRPSTASDVPIGARFFQSTTAPPLFSSDPIMLFAPRAYFRRPLEFPITLMSEITPSVLPSALSVCARLAKEYGATHLRAWGWDRDSELAQAWVKAGGRWESRVVNRLVPYGFCWYGPPGTQGDLIGCEMWAFT